MLLPVKYVPIPACCGGSQGAAVIAWLVHTKVVYTDVTVDTSQNLPPTMVSLFGHICGSDTLRLLDCACRCAPMRCTCAVRNRK